MPWITRQFSSYTRLRRRTSFLFIFSTLFCITLVLYIINRRQESKVLRKQPVNMQEHEQLTSSSIVTALIPKANSIQK
jgi:preprotein translocase subunit SecG